MKAKIIGLLLTVVILSCNKDKFQTKPSLTIKNINTTELRNGQFLQITLEFTDAEGDIQDSIWVQKVEPKCFGSNFTARYKIPTFPITKNLKGTFEVCYSYGSSTGCPLIQAPQCIGKNDTCVFKFWAKDLAKNISDTVTSKKIIIYR